MTAGALLERDAELGLLELAVARVGQRDGGVLLVEGAAGIGKTALLQRVRGFARSAGVTLLEASGGELERDFPYGVVRQLFEPVLRSRDEQARGALLSGAAALAAPIVASGSVPAPEGAPGPDAFAVLHGLYWLTANLAEREPLVILIDDAHWADGPSLRYLAFLARRLEGMAALVVLAARPDEPGEHAGPLRQIAGAATTRVLRPAALSEGAVGELLVRALGEPDPCFVQACHEATAGSPFLVYELVAALAADGVTPGAPGAAARVLALGPSTVANATLLRLGRLTPAALPLANAVAVLGADAQLSRAARLAELDDGEAAAALDALVAAGVLHAGPRLAFVHPIVRAAVYAQLGPGARSAAHARAARMLEADGAEVDSIAAHLLATEPSGASRVVDQLRTAARRALALGAPENAARYLRRALAEGGERQLGVALRCELAEAEKLTAQPSAVHHLREALALGGERVERVQAFYELGETLLYSGSWDEGVEALDSALRELGDDEPMDAQALRVNTLWANVAAYDRRLAPKVEQRLPQLRAAAERGGDAGRGLLLWLAAHTALRGGDAGEVADLVRRGLDEGRFLADEGSESASLSQGLCALVFLDELDEAARQVEEMLADARRRGSVLGFTAGAALRAFVQARRGDLVGVEADLRSALELAQEHGLLFALPVTLWYGAEAIVERSELDDVAALVRLLEPPPGISETVFGAWLLEVRGRLRLIAERDAAAATEDLRRCAATLAALGQRNPSAYGCGSALALALAGSDREEALELAQTELDQARAVGLPRGIGVALRTAGVIEGGEEGLAMLNQAVEVLATSPAKLDLARALVELGGALRRANRRAAARPPLRSGLDLARACGATRLAEQARAELVAAGAKPRRDALSGVAALTPSERRVAMMASDGLSNPEIAQALFVSLNTIETHLKHAYAKLRIHSRSELRDALPDGQAAPAPARSVAATRQVPAGSGQNSTSTA